MKARIGIEPWARTPKSSLVSMGSALRAEHLSEITELLDSLSQQREKIEEETPWDGDATDVVHFAQEEIYTALVASAIPSMEIVKGLDSSFVGTRFWFSLALKEKPNRLVVSAIRRALLVETDQLNRKTLEEALNACGAGG